MLCPFRSLFIDLYFLAELIRLKLVNYGFSLPLMSLPVYQLKPQERWGEGPLFKYTEALYLACEQAPFCGYAIVERKAEERAWGRPHSGACSQATLYLILKPSRARTCPFRSFFYWSVFLKQELIWSKKIAATADLSCLSSENAEERVHFVSTPKHWRPATTQLHFFNNHFTNLLTTFKSLIF